MFTEHVSSVYYKHHIKHRTFFLSTLSMFEKNVKHRANDASDNGPCPPLPPCKVSSKLHDMSVISEGSGLAGSKNDFVGSANF